MESAIKRTDFVVLYDHHTKLFLPAELVLRHNAPEVPDTKIVKKNLAENNKEAMDRQKRINEAKDELKLKDCSNLDVSLLDVEKQRKILEEIQKEKRAAQAKYLLEKATQRTQADATLQTRFQGAVQRTSNTT